MVYCEGTDEFTDGNNTAAHYNHYGQSLNSGETTGIKPIWDNLYGTIEPANLIIANVPAFYNPQSPTYNARLGEGYFLRGYGYFELVKQFGGIPLKLTPSTGVETYFTRNSSEARKKCALARKWAAADFVMRPVCSGFSGNNL